MQTAKIEDWLSPEDYLAQEEHAEQRHEYVDGWRFAMSGGSLRHNRIAGNLYMKLLQHLDGTIAKKTRSLTQFVTFIAKKCSCSTRSAVH